MITINKALQMLLFTNSLLLIAGAMLGPIYAIYVEEIGGGILDASIAGGIYAFVGGIVTLFSGKFTDRVKEKELVIVLGYLLVALGYFLFSYVNNIIYLFIVQGIIGLGEAIYSPAFDAVYTLHTNKRNAGIQWGTWESMYYFSTAVGAVIGGILVTLYSFDLLFYIISMLCIISSLTIYLTPRNLL